MKNVKTSTNKHRKRLQRDIDNLLSEYPDITKELHAFTKVMEVREQLTDVELYKRSALDYVTRRIDDIITFLSTMGFVCKCPDDSITVTIPGIIASQIQELNALGISLILSSSEAFRELIPCEIAGLLACLVPLNLSDDKRTLRPNTPSEILNVTTIELQCSLNKLQTLESSSYIDSGECYDIQFDLQQPVLNWYAASNEEECRSVLREIQHKGISMGDFVKSILKICNCAREIAEASEMLGYKLLSEKLAEIPHNLLKYIATNQSLYV